MPISLPLTKCTPLSIRQTQFGMMMRKDKIMSTSNKPASFEIFSYCKASKKDEFSSCSRADS